MTRQLKNMHRTEEEERQADAIVKEWESKFKVVCFIVSLGFFPGGIIGLILDPELKLLYAILVIFGIFPWAIVFAVCCCYRDEKSKRIHVTVVANTCRNRQEELAVAN